MNEKVELKVPRSGFNKSHTNFLTSKVGTITPILCDEVIPGQKTSVKMAVSATMPPLASETFMNVKLKCEAVFVPMRLLFGSFESWFSGQAVPVADGASEPSDVVGDAPYFNPEDTDWHDTDSGLDNPILDYFERGAGLPDYLGFKHVIDESASPDADIPSISLLPFLAYHRAWDDLYRYSLVTRSCFARPKENYSNPSRGEDYFCGGLPFVFLESGDADVSSSFDVSNQVFKRPDLLADGVSVFSLRQRNYGFDYFTGCYPDPQFGSASAVKVTGQSLATASFTISALRAANSLQQFRERNELPGTRLQDVVKARYGADLSNGVAQRSLLLGACDYDVYSNGVYVNGASNDISSSTTNPFGATTGGRAGSAYGQGSDFIIDNFVSNEPGYIFIFATLVPKAQYDTGIRRYLTHYCGAGSISDMANPILQNVGPQAVSRYELLNSESNAGVFGYQDRYAEFMAHPNEVHGLFVKNGSLDSFVLKRNFWRADETEYISANTAFMEIPTDALDDIAAVKADISNFGYWMSCYFDYKVTMPLSQYSLPSLQDPAYEHGKSVVVHRGGFRL